jgi:hypothetical protein
MARTQHNPGDMPSVIGVGGLDCNDTVAAYSARGMGACIMEDNLIPCMVQDVAKALRPWCIGVQG